MKLYLAAKWESHEEIDGIAKALESTGVKITSTWHDMAKHRQEGVDLPYAEQMKNESWMKAEAFKDIGEIAQADMLVLDTRMESTTGGRDFETGYAMGRMKHFVLVGPRRNPFHSFAWQRFDTWPEFCKWFLEYTHRGQDA